MLDVVVDDSDRAAKVSDLEALERRLDERLEAQSEQLMRHVDERLNMRLGAQSEEIRRHFDMVAEQMRDDVKGLADGTAHHTMVLDDHEARLKKIERRR
jgi:hypothetical protein